jgi:hypothetical protein
MIVSLERAGIALTDLASAVNDGVLSFASPGRVPGGDYPPVGPDA